MASSGSPTPASRRSRTRGPSDATQPSSSGAWLTPHGPRSLSTRFRRPAASAGTVYVRDMGLRAAGERYGYTPSGRVETGASRPVSRREELDWTYFDEVPINERQASAWRAPGWGAQQWTARPPATVLAD